jgi:hypothetical protein
MKRGICLTILVFLILAFMPFAQAAATNGGSCVVGSSAGSTTWYFAEGCTRPGFNTYVCLGNPNDSAASARFNYYLGDGSVVEKFHNIPAQSRATVEVNSDGEIGFRDSAAGDVSIKVTSSLPVVAERPMYFEGTYKGGHDVVGATSLQTNWYFAEGYTGPGFDEYVCVLNTGDAPAGLIFHFQTQEAGPIDRGPYSVAPHSRGTYKINTVLGQNYSASLHLEATQPVVAERPMYFEYLGSNNWHWRGGHCVVGSSSISNNYYFAEGSTRPGFEEWLTLQNPNPAPINISATYQLGSGQGDPLQRSYSVGAGRRLTISVNNEVGSGKDVSVRLTSTDQFLAERPMYFYYTSYGANWTGGHCVIGATDVGKDWFFAEGYTGGGFHEWLTLQNPGDSPANVTVSYLPQGSGAFNKSYTVPAGSRYTIFVNNEAGGNLQLSTRIKSDVGIVAERPMYFDYTMHVPPPPPTPSPTPNPTPTPQPYTYDFSGTGNQATALMGLQAGITTFDLVGNGSSNFIVWLKDQNGNDVELLVNEIGRYSGGRVISVPTTANYFLDISADSSWVVHVTQPRPNGANGTPQTFTGTSDNHSGFFALHSGPATFTMSYGGASNFIIWLYNSAGERVGLLENEIGPRSDTNAINVPQGIYVMDIQGIGSWSVMVSQ